MNASPSSAVPSLAATTSARTCGSARLTVHRVGRRTAPGRVAESGPLRVRFPDSGTETLDAVLINTSGGVVGGDVLQIGIDAGRDTTLLVTTPAAEKVYRSSGPAAQVSVTLRVDCGAHLAWLPQETIVFDRARLSRTIDVELARDARLIACEALLLGRTAMGERVDGGSLRDRWRIRREGHLQFADGLVLEGAIDRTLARPAIGAGANGFATLVYAADDAEERVAPLRAALVQSGLEAGASAEGALLVARLVARDGLTLRRGVVAALAALATTPPRAYVL